MDSNRVETLAASGGLRFLGPTPAVDGHDPVFRYPLAIGEAAATVHALAVDAAAVLWARRGGPRVCGRLEVRRAAASLAGFAVLRFDGSPRHPRQWEQEGPEARWRPWGSDAVLRGENATNPVVGLYRCRDGRWIHLHGGNPRLGDRIMDVLGGERSRAAIRIAVAGWDAEPLEEALADAGTCGAVARTSDEWLAHPQGIALGDLDAVDIEARAGATLDFPDAADTPLAGVRVLDLGDGLAGPTCSRTLARYGADVLQVTAPGRPAIEPFVLDTGHGKRSTVLDLTAAADRHTFLRLVADAHVVCRSYRADALDALGLGDDALRAAKRQLVIAQMNCYGPVGPWAGRRGWEQLGQVTTGLALATSVDGVPRLAPAALCDYLTGYLAAAGVLQALATGHPADVRASLCQSAMWLLRSDVSVDGDVGRESSFDDLLVTTDMPTGVLHHLPPADDLDGILRGWRRRPPELGEHRPEW